VAARQPGRVLVGTLKSTRANPPQRYGGRVCGRLRYRRATPSLGTRPSPVHDWTRRFQPMPTRSRAYCIGWNPGRLGHHPESIPYCVTIHCLQYHNTQRIVSIRANDLFRFFALIRSLEATILAPKKTNGTHLANRQYMRVRLYEPARPAGVASN
jgi:hypothetical protein